MKFKHTYLKLILTAVACLFAANLYAAEEGMEDEGMAEDAGMEDEGGMLEEEALEPAEPFFANQVELGLGYISEDSFKFGEYTGLKDNDIGPYAIGNLFIHWRMPQDGGPTRYWNLVGTNLGLDSRSFQADYGVAGKYEVFLEYDGLPHYQLDDAKTIFTNAGSSHQTLPPGFDRDTPGDAAAALHQVDVDTLRKQIGGGFTLYPAEGWTISAKHEHEFKDGTETIAGMPNSFASAFLIYPVNFNTDEFNLSIARAGAKAQFELGYHLSVFQNHHENLTWQDHLSGTNDPDQLGLPPDNMMQQVSLAGGYNLGQATRLVANMSYSHMTQDEDYLPYTVNPTTVIGTPLPRNSLDGEIDKWFANVGITSMLTRKLRLSGRYTFDYKDNKTPIDVYQYVSRDGNSQYAIDGSGARINRPYGYMKHKFQLDGSYRLVPRAKLSAGYEYENMDRNLRDRHVLVPSASPPFDNFFVDMNEVDTTEEHSGYVKLAGSPTDRTNGWIKYLYAVKTGGDYDSSNSQVWGHSNEFLEADIGAAAPDSDEWYLNHILNRKFNMADRTRHQVKSNINFYATDKFTTGISARYTNDDYDETVIGRTSRDNLSGTLDLSYMPNENVNTYAYYTYDRINNDQAGCDGCDTFDPTSTDDMYSYDTTDQVHSVGAGMTMKASEKVDLAMDYVFSHANTEIDPFIATGGAVGFPDIETTIHSLNLRADYKVNKQMSLRLSYLFEYFHSKDFALDGVGPELIDRILWLGYSSPDYTQNAVGISLLYDF